MSMTLFTSTSTSLWIFKRASPVNLVYDIIDLSHVLSLRIVENVLSALALLIGRVIKMVKSRLINGNISSSHFASISVTHMEFTEMFSSFSRFHFCFYNLNSERNKVNTISLSFERSS